MKITRDEFVELMDRYSAAYERARELINDYDEEDVYTTLFCNLDWVCRCCGINTKLVSDFFEGDGIKIDGELTRDLFKVYDYCFGEECSK